MRYVMQALLWLAKPNDRTKNDSIINDNPIWFFIWFKKIIDNNQTC